MSTMDENRNRMKMCFVIAICLLSMPFAVADVVQSFEEIEIEELFQTLGPNGLLPEFFNQAEKNVLLGGSCSKDLSIYKKGLQHKEAWTKRMLDSSSKIPPGLLTGNFIEMGMYDECMSVHEKKKEFEIIGNHCTYTLFFSFDNKSLAINPMLSICLPLSCGEKDLRQVLHKKMTDTGSYEKFKISRTEVLCSTAHTDDPTKGLIVLGFCTFIILVLLCFTILDWLKGRGIIERDLPKAVSELSLSKNLQSIFSFEDSPGSITAIHGLRAVTTTFIVSGHGFLARVMSLFVNNVEVAYLPSYISLWNGLLIYGVDTFFTISGFLVSYTFLKKYTRSGETFHIGSYYLHRYIRLTPPIAACLLSSIYVIPLMGSGPKWRKFTKDFMVEVCEVKWWTILLYVNNIVHKELKCLGHSWSTSVDMQLFWISPLILYPLVKSPEQGLWLLYSLIAVSIAIPAAITATNQYTILFATNLSFDHVYESFTNLYMATHARASPWLIGILLGYIVFKTPKDLGKTTIFFWWSLTAAIFSICLIGGFIPFLKDYEYNVVFETILASLSRPLWSLAISWIIFAAIRGYGGFVTKFLSLPIFFPISRLSYCLYLVHLGTQLMNTQTVRAPTFYHPYNVLFLGFIEDFSISIAFATFLSVVFEIPARTLEKLIFNRDSQHRKSKKDHKMGNGEVEDKNEKSEEAN